MRDAICKGHCLLVIFSALQPVLVLSHFIRNLRMMNCQVITTVRVDTAVQNILFILNIIVNIYTKCSWIWTFMCILMLESWVVSANKQAWALSWNFVDCPEIHKVSWNLSISWPCPEIAKWLTFSDFRLDFFTNKRSHKMIKFLGLCAGLCWVSLQCSPQIPYLEITNAILRIVMLR